MGVIKATIFVCATIIGVCQVGSARADSINFTEAFRTKVLGCIHPTVNVSKATVEIEKEPSTAGEITSARVKAFYEGLLKKQVMEAEIEVRQAGSIRQMRVKVLSDSSSLHKHCDLENNWSDF